VLIGVIMFVLALTILGLSLFGLSSFEAQFLARSHERQQAFYDALGGLDRARWVLAMRDSLQAVKNGIPYGDGVVFASAWYEQPVVDSTGPVAWSDTTREVWLEVAAVRGRERCALRCAYKPRIARNLYGNLINSSGRLVVENGSNPPPTPPSQGLYLGGHVVQNDPDLSWTGWTPGSYSTAVGGVPAPDVAGYLARWSSPAPPPASHDGVNYHLEASGPGSFKVYLGSSDPSTGGWTVKDEGIKVMLHLQGTGVWLLPKGGYFYQQVVVVGGPSDRLVIVAGESDAGAFPGFGGLEPGLQFRGGIESTAPVILVSDGVIAVEQYNNPFPPDPFVVRYLSALGAGIYLSGPQAQESLQLLHTQDAVYQDAVILDELAEAGLLPNIAPGQNHRLVAVAGTWAQTE
jgi:hypothetical protein